MGSLLNYFVFSVLYTVWIVGVVVLGYLVIGLL